MTNKVKEIEAAAMRLANVNAEIVALGAKREKALADLAAVCGSVGVPRSFKPAKRGRPAKATKRGKAPKKTGITQKLMQHLAEHGSTEARDFAAIFGISSSAVYSLLASRARRGEVVRETGPSGRIVFHLPAAAGTPKAEVAPPVAAVQ